MKVSLSACAKPMMLSVLGVTFVCGEAVAQQSSDIEKVKAASQAFYAALDARDPSAIERHGKGVGSYAVCCAHQSDS